MKCPKCGRAETARCPDLPQRIGNWGFCACECGYFGMWIEDENKIKLVDLDVIRKGLTKTKSSLKMWVSP